MDDVSGKSKSWGSQQSTGKGDGGKRMSQWFEGYCDWCQIYGHKKLDCWTFQKTAEYKKLKEKWAAAGRGGAGARVVHEATKGRGGEAGVQEEDG